MTQKTVRCDNNSAYWEHIVTFLHIVGQPLWEVRVNVELLVLDNDKKLRHAKHSLFSTLFLQRKKQAIHLICSHICILTKSCWMYCSWNLNCHQSAVFVQVPTLGWSVTDQQSISPGSPCQPCWGLLPFLVPLCIYKTSALPSGSTVIIHPNVVGFLLVHRVRLF